MAVPVSWMVVGALAVWVSSNIAASEKHKATIKGEEDTQEYIDEDEQDLLGTFDDTGKPTHGDEAVTGEGLTQAEIEELQGDLLTDKIDAESDLETIRERAKDDARIATSRTRRPGRAVQGGARSVIGAAGVRVSGSARTVLDQNRTRIAEAVGDIGRDLNRVNEDVDERLGDIDTMYRRGVRDVTKAADRGIEASEARIDYAGIVRDAEQLSAALSFGTSMLDMGMSGMFNKPSTLSSSLAGNNWPSRAWAHSSYGLTGADRQSYDYLGSLGGF